MKAIARLMSVVALAATVLIPMVYLAGGVELPTMKTCLTIATLLWFVATPTWMGRSGE